MKRKRCEFEEAQAHMATIMNGILARRVWELTVPGTVVTCLSDHEWHHCVKSVRCAFSADACCSCSWCMGAKSNAFRSSWTAAWFVSTFLVVTAVRMGLAVTRSECAVHVRPAITVKRSTEDMVVPTQSLRKASHSALLRRRTKQGICGRKSHAIRRGSP